MRYQDPFDHNPPPQYGSDTNGFSQGQGSATEDSIYSNAWDSRQTQDRTNYAVALQRSCHEVVRNIKSSEMFVKSDWESPLAAAPQALSIMALCLKSAATKDAATLKITNLEVKSGGKVVGQLPSVFFYTNLQYCSDIGRLAFIDAQKRMSSVRSTAQSIVSDAGPISYILELLEDIEDARDNLGPEMDGLVKTANECKEKAVGITEQFDYWQAVIYHMKMVAQDARSDTTEKEKENKTKVSIATDKEKQWQEEKASAEAEIEKLRKLLSDAENDIQAAQSRLEREMSRPLVKEPSVYEEESMARTARDLVPDTPMEELGSRGFFGKLRDMAIGSSSERVSELEKMRMQHEKKLEEQRNNMFRHARQAREEQRRTLQARLDQAVADEHEVSKRLEDAVKRFSGSEHRLSDARSQLSKTTAELTRLGNEKVEIESIMEVLSNSIRDLVLLKEHIDQLIIFFSEIVKEINSSMDSELNRFLNPIKHGIKTNTETQRLEALNIRNKSRQHLTKNALLLQARFSAIADISGLYVTVSDTYIRPGINKMENLAALDGDAYNAELKVFTGWCNQAVQGIHDISVQGRADALVKMEARVKDLGKRAIEANKESNE